MAGDYLCVRCLLLDQNQIYALCAGLILPTASHSKGLPMPTPEPAIERVPMMQRVLDNPFLLLFLGVTIPTVLYLIWGVMEVASVPLAK
jgi:hypothetical protein